jgi:hypothetical protein
MEIYANRGGNSNVESFELGNDFIAVKFKSTSKIYVYSYSSAGAYNVYRAKVLAKDGSGLGSHIMWSMRNDFER